MGKGQRVMGYLVASDPAPAILSILTLVTAAVGLITAVQVSRSNGKKLQAQGEEIGQVHVLVNSNLAKVQRQLESAILHIAELEERLGEVSHTALPPHNLTPDEALQQIAKLASIKKLTPEGDL